MVTAPVVYSISVIYDRYYRRTTIYLLFFTQLSYIISHSYRSSQDFLRENLYFQHLFFRLKFRSFVNKKSASLFIQDADFLHLSFFHFHYFI